MVTDGWMDGPMDGQNNGHDGPMDTSLDGQCFSLVQVRYIHLKMKIFENIRHFLHKHDRRRDGPIDG